MLFIAKNKISKGLSLIEASMVLALSAVVISGVLFYYQTSRSNLEQTSVVEMFMVIESKMHSLYANQPKSAIAGLDVDTGLSMMSHAYPELKQKTIETLSGKQLYGLTSTSVPGIFRIYGSSSFSAQGTSTLDGSKWSGISEPHFVIQYWFPASYTEQDAVSQCMYLASKNWGTAVYGVQTNGSGNSQAYFITSSEVSTGMEEISSACKGSTGVSIFFKS